MNNIEKFKKLPLDSQRELVWRVANCKNVFLLEDNSITDFKENDEIAERYTKDSLTELRDILLKRLEETHYIRLTIEHVTTDENNELHLTQIGPDYDETTILGKILLDYMDHGVKVTMKMATKDILIMSFHCMYGGRITELFEELLKDYQDTDSIRLKIYED